MDAVFATRRVGTDAVFARLFFSATDGNAPGGTGTSTGSGSGGTATGGTAGSGNAPGGTGTSTGSGSGGSASGEGWFSGSLSDADIARIAAAVLAALQASPVPFPANVKKVNDVTIKGIGTQSNPWNPV